MYRLFEDMACKNVFRFKPVDPDCGDVLLHGSPLSPLRLRVASGKRRKDFLFGTKTGICLISRRVQDAFADAGFSGWSTYDLDIEFGDETLSGYKGLHVNGRSGPIQRDLSVLQLRPVAPGLPPVPHMVGLHPDMSEWDGSNIFVPANSRYICINSSVKDAIDATGATGAAIEDLEEFAILAIR